MKKAMLLVLGSLLGSSAMAIDYCELNGKQVRNMEEIAGMTGILKCKDGVTNAPIYEKEVRNGALVGQVKEYTGGVLVRDYSVNAKGAFDGPYKEFVMTGRALVMTKELTYKNGAPIGILKSYTPQGALKRISYTSTGNREESFAEFTVTGRLADLMCTKKPVFEKIIDDAMWCGHKGSPVVVTFYGEDNYPKSKNTFFNGLRTKRTMLWNNGKPRLEETATAQGGIDKVFYESGLPKSEIEWVYQGEARTHVMIVEKLYHENGKLISEKRWRPIERGTQPVSVSSWYDDGSPKVKSDFILRGAPPELVRREVMFHQNGKISGQGIWGTNGLQDTTPRGVISRFNDQGVLISEYTYNERGTLLREREFDNSGKALQDNEITPDGRRIPLIGKTDVLPEGLVPTPRR